MEIKNIRSHRIRWRQLVGRGAVVGLVAAIVMLATAAIAFPIASSGADPWSFLKVASAAVLGGDAAQPLAGFEATPVFVGLGVHLVLGVLAGITYALLVAFFDLEGWTPVALFGLLYGMMLFVWTTVLLEAVIDLALTEEFPIMVMFLGDMVFGLTAGVLLATWADEADIDQELEERVPVFEGDDPNVHHRLH